jgi:pimeloyl-ACP methyl ester carboxylesterase
MSPCEDGLFGDLHQRGFFPPYNGFHVLQGTYQAPAYQQGTRPYLRPEDGGAFVLDGSGVPVQQGTESMCYALAVPIPAVAVPPFPVVVYGHGTGGSFHSAMTDVAPLLTAQGFAVVGFDNVMHGRRQQPLGTPQNSALWQDPGQLFFNLPNPRASRDNVLQGAADLFFLVHLLESDALTGPDGEITFDDAKIFYVGHSQGTVIAPAFLEVEPDLQAAVLSGAGAELALSILNKKEPADVSMAAGAFFGDQGLSRIHPMMGILAMTFGPADAVSYAPTWVLAPQAPRTSPLPLLMFSGIGDSYTPDVTQHALMRAAGLPIVGTAVQPVAGVSEVASPRAENGVIQLQPDGAYDGHFVMFDHADGPDILEHFLTTALTGAPEVER